jgi:hypothetical protein
MPLVDHFAGNLGGPAEAGNPTNLGAWFDGDETTVGIMHGTSGSEQPWVIDLGAVQTIDTFRLSWHYGSGGFGNANGFAIESGPSAVGPWTEELADPDPVATAGVTYPDDFELTYELVAPIDSRYWRIKPTTVGNNDLFTVNGYETVPDDPDEPPVDPGYEAPGPAKAILEIYVHDEDATRWDTATWSADLTPTGTEGIWSDAGWQDVTPQGVRVHIQWGSRRPDRGILADQDAASWRVETYDPDRVLDPGNPDSPYAPQLVAGVPIRISHAGMVIRTGEIDRMTYAHKAPDYRGEILASDSIAILNRAEVPDASVLDDTLLARIQDAIDASGVNIGGIPVRPDGPAAAASVALSAQIDGNASVWRHVNAAAREALWVVFVNADGSLGLRPWGEPLDRGAEIADPLLEDMTSVTSEDGTYSVVRVTDDASAVIERVAAPLPRYGRRTYERTETTADAEAWADAILAERAWPGVQWIPGTIHAFTAADVDMLGRLEIMERVLLTIAGVVSVSGRILGGELWAQHRLGADQGATWMFRFYVATEGASAIGLTTLVSDQSGEPLVDDDGADDYLEAD